MIRALLVVLLASTPVKAQVIDPGPLDQSAVQTRQRSAEVASGSVATLRALDKVSGALVDLEIPVGTSAVYQRLTVEVVACRYPVENAASDAFAYLRIFDATRGELLFQGWMMASSPALNALDHPRHDVWVLTCR